MEICLSGRCFHPFFIRQFINEMKKYIVLLHILFWISVPFILTFISWIYQFTAFVPVKGIISRSYLTVFYQTALINFVLVLVGCATFYLTLSIAISAAGSIFLKKTNIIKLLLILVLPGMLILLLSSVSFAVYWSFGYFLLSAYLAVVPFAWMGILSAVVQTLITTKDELLLLEKVNTAAQLDLVKSRTDPHFLFNTINNIDSLLIKDPEKASQYLNRLSGLLRFMLYESAAGEIPLASEINYITEYINLEKIRSVNPEFVKFSVHGNVNGHLVAPMVFIPILENAFKHVSSRTTAAAIVAELDIQDREIVFKCMNMYDSNKRSTLMNNGLGWGLIRQRLELLYGNRYRMEVNKHEMYYEVVLTLFKC
ncbi:His-kinase domain-containing protein [Chitinophaga sp. 180180018-2]|nr:His-kinase domain-containing protein [Chitinophaga sp. 212800010-3]